MKAELDNALSAARKKLVDQMNPGGFWEGELSSSALATALAVFALAQVDQKKHHDAIFDGLRWMAENVNADGGWGDSPDSQSNISATLLCWSAFSITDPADRRFEDTVGKAESWLTNDVGSLEPADIASAVVRSYGNDRTFSAPILTMCALAGRLGPSTWKLVPQLPFELAVFPRRMFRFLRLSVVSYAIPALIAIGLVRHVHRPVKSPVRRGVRRLVTKRVLKVLKDIQPDNGGFLEATPLTGFVVMSLAASGYREHPVTRRGAEFLLSSARDDGSWPIDTNLATWVTTLAVGALTTGNTDEHRLSEQQKEAVRDWLLAQQYTERHRFTCAEPGGWAWTDLPGAVPDADDTSGALLALTRLGAADDASRKAAAAGIRWLMGLQNADGGIPTFCRGWGKLPFDRSCPDITAHALRAFDAWYDELEPGMQARVNTSMTAATGYLERVQRDDGAWIPLWFGNQRAPGRENPTYGTAQTVLALREIAPGRLPNLDLLIQCGTQWLLSAQNGDGGWGGAPDVESSIEETALAVRALAGLGQDDAVEGGVRWLIQRTDGGSNFPRAPIGLYFASLWYSEKLYPLVFTAAALGRC